MKNDKATRVFFLAMLWGCTAILSAYQFPLNRMFEPDIKILPLAAFLLFFGALGSMMTRIYGPGKSLHVLVLTLIFCSLGVAVRYFLLYTPGIFTLNSVVEYIITVTLYTTIAYNWFPKKG